MDRFGTDAHAPFHTLILITLDVFATFRELREDCGVDLGRVKHLQRLEAKRGTITAFFAKQVIPLPSQPASPSLSPVRNLPPTTTLLADNGVLETDYDNLFLHTRACLSNNRSWRTPSRCLGRHPRETKRCVGRFKTFTR